MRLAFYCALMACAVLLAVPAAYADPELGVADDSVLPTAPGALLDAAEGHGATFVRTVIYMNRETAPSIAAAREARARGIGMHAVLALPRGDAQIGITPEQYAAWAATTAAELRATGVDLRLSLLNEPDGLLPVADACATSDAVRSTLTRTGYVSRDQRVRAPKTRRIVIRRRGRRPVKRRVIVTRVIRRKVVRRGKRRIVRKRVPVMVWRSVHTLVPTSYSTEVVTLTPRRGCFMINRAHLAAQFLRIAIPAVRSTAPGVPIDVGETSPCIGVETFIAELGRIGIPPVDGWAHHPYPFLVGGEQEASPDGNLGADKLPRLAADMRAAFGALPLDLTEFGVPTRRHEPTTQTVIARVWRKTFALACEVGVRELVAYQWGPTPTASVSRWDTGILADDGGRSLASAQMTGLRC